MFLFFLKFKTSINCIREENEATEDEIFRKKSVFFVEFIYISQGEEMLLTSLDPRLAKLVSNIEGDARCDRNEKCAES